jgi:hypothetical protein
MQSLILVDQARFRLQQSKSASMASASKTQHLHMYQKATVSFFCKSRSCPTEAFVQPPPQLFGTASETCWSVLIQRSIMNWSLLSLQHQFLFLNNSEQIPHQFDNNNSLEAEV